MSAQGVANGEHRIAPQAGTPVHPKASVDARRLLVAQSLQVGNPGNNARDLPGGPDLRGARDQLEQQIELTVDDIRPYENNPRRSLNVKFDDIKESIRTSGLRSPLTVTRRPGESHFIIEAGGNTRLLVLQQLWSETRDPRYRQLVVLFRPWRSESHVLSAHLVENEQRGEMSFWDKATGIVALKQRLEAEQAKVLALRPLEDALHAVGLAVNTATLGHYLFACERLRTLGEAVVGLAGLDVKTLQPRLNALKRYALARKPSSEDELYASVFEPVFRGIADRYPHTAEFSAAETCEACEAAMAAHLGEAVDALREGLRPTVARGGQGDRLTGSTDAASGSSSDVSTPVGQGEQRELGPPAPDDLVRRVRAFADVAGLGDCVQSDPASAAGFRLAASPEQGDAPLVQRRARWLLAGLSGQVDAEALPPMPLESEFIFWLADPADASATAFWEVLACLRRARSPEGGSNAAGGQANAAEGGLMLPLHDTQVRLVLLGHVTSRLAEARPDELDAVGIGNEQLDRLRQLSALDLNRLAAMRTLTIGISLDGNGLQAGLRAVALVKEAKALEAYFIRQGASTRLMCALFKVRRKLALKLRRDLGVCHPSGRVPLPDYATRERIYRVWRSISDPAPRVRYFQLHQAFLHLPIAVLEVVVRDFEENT